jgi:hypothetical protein
VKHATIIEAVTTSVGGLPTPRAGIDEVLLTRKQVARRQQTTPETLIRWEKQGLLKPVRLGCLVRYRLSDVLAFEQAGESARIAGKRTPKQRLQQPATSTSEETRG